MANPQIKEIESLCSKLAGRMTDEFEWHLAGGGGPVEPGTLEELAQLSKDLKRSVKRGTDHRMERRTLRRYRWRRVYDSDGKIDYDLVKVTNERP